MELCYLEWTSPSQKTGIQFQRNSPYLTDVQWDMSKLLFVGKKEMTAKCKLTKPAKKWHTNSPFMPIRCVNEECHNFLDSMKQILSYEVALGSDIMSCNKID